MTCTIKQSAPILQADGEDLKARIKARAGHVELLPLQYGQGTGVDNGTFRRKDGGGALLKKLAPFLTVRWWILHSLAIAAVYTAGHLLFGG
jgi:hypothetical protein